MRFLRVMTVLIVVALSANLSSCFVTTKHTTNNGKHKGWNKNTNNPHHPQTTNPGHTKKAKGKKK